MGKPKCDMHRRQLRRLPALVLTAALAILVMLNLVADAAEKRLPLVWDLTRDKVFALSEQTIEVLSSFRKDVQIDVMCDALTLENGGGYYTQAKKIIDQYPVYGNTITVTYRDPVSNPGFLAQHADMELAEYDILVTCGERKAKTNIFELFNAEYNEYTGKQHIRSSKAEQEITSALLRVSAEETAEAVLLTGQQENYTQALRELLQANGYGVSEESLITGSLDTQADVAFLLAPTRDLSKESLQALDDYLENGGEYGRVLVYAPGAQTNELPNLEAFLRQWGIEYGTGLVMESNSERYINATPYLSLVEYVDKNDILKVRTDIPFFSPFGREMYTGFEAQSAHETQVLLRYSESAYAMPVLMEDGWMPTDEDFNAYPALICSQYTQYEGTLPKRSTVLAFASEEAVGAAALENVSFSNAEYLLSLLGDLSGREDFIQIPAKSLTSSTLGITQAQFLCMTIIFMLLLPATVAAAGIGIWLWRKNK